MTAPTPAPVGPGPLLAGAGLIGAASGLRSQLGVAAVALTTRAVRSPRAAAVLTGRGGRAGLAAAALGELAADKLPVVPSRLTPAGLLPRIVLGGLAAAALAARPAPDPVEQDPWIRDPDRDPWARDAEHDPWPRDVPPDAWSQDDDVRSDTGAWILADAPAVPDRPQRSRGSVALAAAVGASAAFGAAFAGAWWRRQAVLHARPDWPAALLEDAAALTLAWSATALTSRPVPAG